MRTVRVVNNARGHLLSTAVYLNQKSAYSSAMVGRPRNAVVLTDTERAALLKWTRSRTCSQALALRAQIVLCCEHERTNTAVAQSLGISRGVVGKWRSRFLDQRLDGLHEQPRPGRPRAVDDDAVAAVLVRTLAPAPGARHAWSTRSMAAETGLSQTTVNRIWRAHRIHPAPGSSPRRAGQASLLPAEIHDVVGLFLDPPVRVLAVSATPHRTPLHDRRPAGRGADRRRAETRNLFAVANAFASLRGMTTGTPGDRVSLRAFLGHLDRTVAASMNVHLLAGGLDEPALRTVDEWLHRQPRFRCHSAPDQSSWIDEIDFLLANNPLPGHENLFGFAASLTKVRNDVRAWCRTWTPRTSPYSWAKSPRALWSGDAANRSLNNDSKSVSETTSEQPGRDLEPTSPIPDDSATASGTTDRVVHLVREALAAGQYHAGERVKEAPLAARLGVSRGPIREALRVLAEEGMLERLPNRGAAVPDVSATNILDLYAVRASLGALVMRRVAVLGQAHLQPVNTALAEVRAAARNSDDVRIGEADLCFQDAIARTANLPQASSFFERLTMRLRMFISVLRLGYAEAGDLIARENAAIFDALRNGDGNEAARLWRVKVERSVRYMVAQLPRDHFDPDLWITIAGKPNPRPSDPRNLPR
ncbi:GntR family transcriptional regulator [Saccharopolyspora pogona]|uniref:GntR family transcriptional regulator n=1 Tax=Saccharopolyspora pogona TaxID=333966 RepID=UPI001CC24FF5|nr:GntR family transcriptional regulator [Saccharopolyspora pogona]